MTDTFIIKPRRPLEANLPAHAVEGELIITRDTHKIFTGEGPNAPLAQCGGGTDDDSSFTTKTYVDTQDAATLAAAETHSDTSVAAEAVARIAGDSTEATARIAGDVATLASAHSYTNAAVAPKADSASLATVATSGSYNDLSNKPTIPTLPITEADVTGLTADLALKLNTSSLARQSVQVVTASLAAGVNEQLTVALGKSFNLLSVQVDKKCRVELYANAAKRTADVARPIGTDPTPGSSHGVVCDFALTSAQTFICSPVIDGANMESVPVVDIPYTITNIALTAQAITVTFVFVRTEQ
jgi:hypothetical protein